MSGANPEVPLPRPVPGPDLGPYRHAHRALLGELARLTLLAEDVAADRSRVASGAAGRLAAEIEAVCAGITAHLRVEDELLWPVLTATAGAAVDLGPLGDDHAVIRVLVGRAGDSAFSLTDSDPDGGPTTALPALCHALRELREALQEHIDEEEREVFPIITSYVQAEDFGALAGRLLPAGDR